MEGPFDFDIWCKIDEKALKTAAVWTANMVPISVIDAYKLVRDSVKENHYIQIFVDVGWDDIPKLQQELPDFVQQNSSVVTQATYEPSICKKCCLKHKLLYVRETCPVCDGFYINRVFGGQRYCS